jgi:hypothetical protein
MTKNNGTHATEEENKSNTFQLFGMVTVPDELSTETNKFLH